MKTLILIVTLITLSTVAYAQEIALKFAIEQELALENKPVTYSRVADAFTEHLLREYEYGQDFVDRALETDSSWYYMIDLYIHQDKNVILDLIKNDEAGFRDVNVKNASISVAYNGTDYVVLIASYVQ